MYSFKKCLSAVITELDVARARRPGEETGRINPKKANDFESTLFARRKLLRVRFEGVFVFQEHKSSQIRIKYKGENQAFAPACPSAYRCEFRWPALKAFDIHTESAEHLPLEAVQVAKEIARISNHEQIR